LYSWFTHCCSLAYVYFVKSLVMLLLCYYFSLYHCIWLYENKDNVEQELPILPEHPSFWAIKNLCSFSWTFPENSRRPGGFYFYMMFMINKQKKSESDYKCCKLAIYKITLSFRNLRLSSSERLCWVVWSITRSFTILQKCIFTWNMKLFLSCAGNFPVLKFIYKLAKIEKKTNKTKQKQKKVTLIYFTFWLVGQFTLAIWCEVPHCFEDRNATSRCIALDRLVMEMGCCLLDIYPYPPFPP
jgi:hypothetical protein